MKQTKKVALSAMTVALGAVLVILGGYIEVLDLSVLAIASLLIIFIHIEIGPPYTWLVWLCTTLMIFIFMSSRIELSLMYFLLFGIYPILKAYIERLPHALWFILKLIYINVIIWVIILVWEKIYGMSIFALDGLFKNIGENWLYLIFCAVANIGFMAYDLFTTVMIRIYIIKLRNRIKHLLK